MPRPPLTLALLVPTLAVAQNLTGLITEAHAPTTPIRGAVIRIRQPGAPLLAAELESGNDGRFSAPIPLPPGDYRIEINKPNHGPATLNLRLPAAAPLNVQLTRYGTITGRVTDAQNRPLPGASVITMVAAEEDPAKFRAAQAGVAASVDTAGNYRVFNLAPGRYALAVTWANMSSGGREAPIAGAYLFPSNSKPEIFTVTSGTAVTGINFTLPAQSDYTVSGRVTGLPPKQTAALALALRDQPTLAAALLQTTPEGKFRFDRVAPGSYDLRAAAPMQGYGALGAILGDNSAFGQTRVDVAGQDITGVEVALEPSRMLKFSLRSTPECPAVPVSLLIEPVENWATLFTNPITLKPNQETIAKDLAPGRYRIRTSHPEGVCSGPAAFVADTGSSETIRITLEAPGTIEARVASPHAAVTLTYLDDPNVPAQILPAQREGPYRFQDLRPGRYRLQSGTAATDLEVRPGATTQAVVQSKEPKQ